MQNNLDDHLPDFSGKLLLLCINGGAAANMNHFISDVHFEMLGSRLFLVGQMADRGQGTWNGAHTAVAWDTVEKFVVLNSLDELKQRDAPYQKKKWFFSK